MKKILLCVLCALLAFMMAACVSETPPAATPVPETATPEVVVTASPSPAPTADNALDVVVPLDGDVPTGVRNVAITLATLTDEQVELLCDYVFGSDMNKTNLYEDSWEDNGVVTLELKQWEMKNPDDQRILTISNTGEIMFDRAKDSAPDGLNVDVAVVRAQVIELLELLGLPTDISEGRATLLPEDMDIEGLGLYPEYVFEINPIEGYPISQMCALRLIASSDGDSLMAFSFNGIRSSRTVGGDLTLISRQQAYEAITTALADSPYIKNVTIDDVRLCYDFRRVRGQAGDGLLVPAWEFANPTGESYLVDAVTGAALGGYGEEVVAEPSELQ